MRKSLKSASYLYSSCERMRKPVSMGLWPVSRGEMPFHSLEIVLRTCFVQGFRGWCRRNPLARSGMSVSLECREGERQCLFRFCCHSFNEIDRNESNLEAHVHCCIIRCGESERDRERTTWILDECSCLFDDDKTHMDTRKRKESEETLFCPQSEDLRSPPHNPALLIRKRNCPPTMQCSKAKSFFFPRGKTER